MQRARVYDIRNGDTDYSNMLSPEKDFIFWDESILDKTLPGDVVFFVNREEREALYTVATDVVQTGIRNPRSWLKEFEYADGIYGAREGDEFRRYDVCQIAAIPAGWKWEKPLRQTEIADLWIAGEQDNSKRLTKMNDLLQLFPSGPACEMLEICNMHVEGVNMTINETNIIMKLITPAKKKNALKKPHNDKKEIVAAVTFDHPDRKLLMCIRTKPFVLLTGVSGTGKSWTARKLAYMTCSDRSLQWADQPGNFEMIRVRPDWLDPDDLLGYGSTQGGVFRYHCTDLLRFIVRAWRYPEVPFFVCLDEMNLGQIEHYFSDFLSVLETGRMEEGRLVYDPFISRDSVAQYCGDDPTFWSQLKMTEQRHLQQYFLERGIVMPANLIVLGTVNINEATHSLSGRVLDRAMVIQMKGVDLQQGLMAPAAAWEYPETFGAATLLTASPVNRYEAYVQQPEIGMRIIRELEKLFAILDNTAFELSHRVKNDTLVYCFANHALAAAGPLPENWLTTCLDEVITMKILVRIGGDVDTCGEVIERLLPAVRYYPATHQKLLRMHSALEKGAYTSFW